MNVDADQAASVSPMLRQHLIDPEICIRCNTCEETCPLDAITHDSRNYVVDPAVCNACNACVSPCPTGAIDNWRNVPRASAWSLADQLQWDVLPPPAAAAPDDPGGVPAEIAAITALASAGQGGTSAAPWSAATPSINLHPPERPAVATVTGNFRLTAEGTTSDIRHLVLDFGSIAFPVLEGQTIGIVPPGRDADGRPHQVRLYSVASPRDGERPRYNNVAITVKRVTEDHAGQPIAGIASNYLCALERGANVQVVGPFGASFLMPDHPGARLLMICTGTGSAPMRAMTERRRRRVALDEGGDLMLFFGARTPEELPYCGPLMKLPASFIDINLAYSRVPGQPRQYVQDLIRARGGDVARRLADPQTFIYVCGLKGMEQGVADAFREVCTNHGQDWDALLPALRAQGRYHLETY